MQESESESSGLREAQSAYDLLLSKGFTEAEIASLEDGFMIHRVTARRPWSITPLPPHNKVIFDTDTRALLRGDWKGFGHLDASFITEKVWIESTVNLLTHFNAPIHDTSEGRARGGRLTNFVTQFHGEKERWAKPTLGDTTDSSKRETEEKQMRGQDLINTIMRPFLALLQDDRLESCRASLDLPVTGHEEPTTGALASTEPSLLVAAASQSRTNKRPARLKQIVPAKRLEYFSGVEGTGEPQGRSLLTQGDKDPDSSSRSSQDLSPIESDLEQIGSNDGSIGSPRSMATPSPTRKRPVGWVIPWVRPERLRRTSSSAGPRHPQNVTSNSGVVRSRRQPRPELSDLSSGSGPISAVHPSDHTANASTGGQTRVTELVSSDQTLEGGSASNEDRRLASAEALIQLSRYTR